MLCNCLINVLILIITAVILAVIYMKWKFQHWKRKGVPYIEPRVPFGTIQSSDKTKMSLGELMKKRYEFALSRGYRHLGLYVFWKPTYMPADPKLVGLILSKDFHYFSDRNIYYNERDDPISAHLFSLETKRWRPLRAKLTPTFSSGKIKAMLETVINCGTQLKDAVDKTSEGGEPLDIKEILGRFTTNVIGSCAFGLDCNCFEDSDSEFIKYSKKFFILSPLRMLKTFLGFTSPGLARFLRIPAVERDVSDFFRRVTKENVRFREENGVVRNDFLHLLIQLKNHRSTDGSDREIAEGLTMEEVCSQAFLFFLAGYETSASTMTFCLYELAANGDLQTKLRKEVLSMLQKHGGKITYEGLQEMKYMDQVIDETLRKYPPLPFLNRECVEDYKVPGTDLVIEKNTMVSLPIEALQNDPQYFEDPERFDPERFSDENRHKIVPFTYLPFGEGPRNCIGLRFGKMQVKVGLTVLLGNYEFVVNKKTEIPFRRNPQSVMLNIIGGIWLDVKKIK